MPVFLRFYFLKNVYHITILYQAINIHYALNIKTANSLKLYKTISCHFNLFKIMFNTVHSIYKFPLMFSPIFWVSIN